MHLRHAPAVAFAALALLAAGCGDDNNDSSSSDSGGAAAAQSQPADQGQLPQQQVPQQQPTTPKPATGGVAAKLGVGKDLSKKPKISTPKGQAPSKLTVYDVVKGKGAPVRAGDQVTMRYVGVTFADGKQFDASWDKGQDFGPFVLGAGMVIPGWDEGIPGMRKGGRRVLVIPSDLAYGATGGPGIAPNSALVFAVDLKDSTSTTGG